MRTAAKRASTPSASSSTTSTPASTPVSTSSSPEPHSSSTAPGHQAPARVRAIYPARNPDRVAARVTDEILQKLARGITGKLGGRVGVAPRVFLRKLVLDKVDAHADYDPTQHFELIVSAAELTPEERAAAGLPAPSVDDIPLDLP